MAVPVTGAEGVVAVLERFVTHERARRAGSPGPRRQPLPGPDGRQHLVHAAAHPRPDRPVPGRAPRRRAIEVDLGRLVRAIAEDAGAANPWIQFRVGRLPVVTGDPVGFRQLFTNLIGYVEVLGGGIGIEGDRGTDIRIVLPAAVGARWPSTRGGLAPGADWLVCMPTDGRRFRSEVQQLGDRWAWSTP